MNQEAIEYSQIGIAIIKSVLEARNDDFNFIVKNQPMESLLGLINLNIVLLEAYTQLSNDGEIKEEQINVAYKIEMLNQFTNLLIEQELNQNPNE